MNIRKPLTEGRDHTDEPVQALVSLDPPHVSDVVLARIRFTRACSFNKLFYLLNAIVDDVDLRPENTVFYEGVTSGRRYCNHGSSSIQKRHDPTLQEPSYYRQRKGKLGKPLLVVDVVDEQHNRLRAEQWSEEWNTIPHIYYPIKSMGVEKQKQRGIEIHGETPTPAHDLNAVNGLVTHWRILPTWIGAEHSYLVTIFNPMFGLLKEVYLGPSGLWVPSATPIEC